MTEQARLRRAQEMIMVALDVDDVDRALRLIDQLRPCVGGFKIGLELWNAFMVHLMTHEQGRAHAELDRIRPLFINDAAQLFIDIKLHDVPRTVAGAVRQLAQMGVRIIDVHCTGGEKMMRDAVKAAEEVAKASPSGVRPKILGVTILTSLDIPALMKMGLASARLMQMEPVEQARILQGIVHSLALLAKNCGLDGVICSPQETGAIRQACGPDFIIGNPSVRSLGADVLDQRRVDTPANAIAAGASFVVVGSEIVQCLNGDPSPVAAARRIARDIAAVL